MSANPMSLVPHLCVDDAEAAIAFYERAFGARCTDRQSAPDGKRLIHAALSINGGEIMLHDEFPEYDGSVLSPKSRGGASVAINLNLPRAGEVDRTVAMAQEAGAEIIMEPQDTFWGARYGRVRDPFGHVWACNAPLGGSEST